MSIGDVYSIVTIICWCDCDYTCIIRNRRFCYRIRDFGATAVYRKVFPCISPASGCSKALGICGNSSITHLAGQCYRDVRRTQRRCILFPFLRNSNLRLLFGVGDYSSRSLRRNTCHSQLTALKSDSNCNCLGVTIGNTAYNCSCISLCNGISISSFCGETDISEGLGQIISTLVDLNRRLFGQRSRSRIRSRDRELILFVADIIAFGYLLDLDFLIYRRQLIGELVVITSIISLDLAFNSVISNRSCPGSAVCGFHTVYCITLIVNTVSVCLGFNDFIGCACRQVGETDDLTALDSYFGRNRRTRSADRRLFAAVFSSIRMSKRSVASTESGAVIFRQRIIISCLIDPVIDTGNISACRYSKRNLIGESLFVKLCRCLIRSRSVDCLGDIQLSSLMVGTGN